MSKDNALVTLETPYLALRQTLGVTELMEENLGGGTLSLNDLPRVKMPAGGMLMWMVPGLDGDDGYKELVGTVLHFQDDRKYWATALSDSETTTPPDCSSPNGLVGYSGKEYSGDVMGEPVYKLWGDNPVPGCQSCATCPFAQWGSGRNNSQACKTGRRIFFLMHDSPWPIQINLSPTSIPVAKNFFLKLVSRGIKLSQAELIFGLEAMGSGANRYARVTVRLGRLLSDAEAAGMREIRRGLLGALDTEKQKEAVAA